MFPMERLNRHDFRSEYVFVSYQEDRSRHQTPLWFLPGERGIRLIVYLTEMIELHECRDCFQWVDREREEDCQDNIMNGN